LRFLSESYSFIERKLKNREYPHGFAEYYDTDIRSFTQYYLHHAPNGPKRELLLSNFLQRAVAEASEFFFRGLSSELDLQKQLAEEHIKRIT
jgi:hypothetical protein